MCLVVVACTEPVVQPIVRRGQQSQHVCGLNQLNYQLIQTLI